MCLTGGARDHRDCAPPGGHTGCRGKQRKVLTWNAVKDSTFNDDKQNLVLSCILLRILYSKSRHDNRLYIFFMCHKQGRHETCLRGTLSPGRRGWKGVGPGGDTSRIIC